MSTRRLVRCTECDKTKPHEAHGWCSACCARWRRAGRPAHCPKPRSRHQFTPETQAAAQATRRANRDYRLEEYAFLRSAGETPERAAERIGVSEWTARQYDKALAQQNKRGQEAA